MRKKNKNLHHGKMTKFVSQVRKNARTVFLTLKIWETFRRRFDFLMVLGVHVVDEVNDSVGVAVLVVVPGDQLDEGGRKLDSGLSVEDG